MNKSGTTVQTQAIFLGILFEIAYIIFAIFLGSEFAILGVILFFGGTLINLLIVFVLYAFGNLVNDVQAIRKQLEHNEAVDYFDNKLPEL